MKRLFTITTILLSPALMAEGAVAEAESPSQSGCEPIKIHGRTDTKAYLGTSIHLPIN